MATEPEATSTVWDEWETFRNLGHFVNHWERPGWTERTQTYHWFLTFEGADGLRRLARQCQSQLDDMPTLDLVPPPLLHLTIERLGFTDEVNSADVTSIVDAARERCSKLTPFSVRIGPLTGSAGAIRFSVTPHDPIQTVRSLLIDAQNEVIVQDNDDGRADDDSTYVPHVSVAYSNAEAPTTAIIERVELLRALGSITVPIRHVDLVRLRRDNFVYVWDTVAAVELGG